MSLNGLDDVKVKEAYEVAAVEPGGWFLLKYASRDEVELLERGNGGIVEIRNHIAQFEEPSPLFGFLRYRRRNVIIKYVPEGCSRLVQARVTVHFTAITERFSPHDTEFSITSSKELRDTTLSAACSLHTASGSTSSSTSSLRNRRLMEISEEAEEDAKRQSVEDSPSTNIAPSIIAASVPLPASPPKFISADSFRSVISDLETSPPPPREPQLDVRPNSPSKTLDERRRKSSQSSRPELYSLSSFGSNGKPKIKLGPRPSLDVGGRPHTSSATSHFRPVSQLPAGVKLFRKSSKKDKDRPRSHLPTDPSNLSLSPPPIPETMAGSLQLPQTRPHTSGGRPTTSSGISVKSAASPNTTAFPKIPTMTPEKARLMKALELRKKREMAPPVPTSTSQTANVEGIPVGATEENDNSKEPAQEVIGTLSMLNNMSKADDSGIAFDASSIMRTDESDATRSDSYPVSPVGPSEGAESTKASSISGSTDETVLDADTSKLTIREPKFEKEDESAAQQQLDTTGSTEEDVEKEVEEVEDLPFLKARVYTPLQSPVATEANFSKDSVAQEVVVLMPSDVASRIPTERSLDEHITREDVLKTSLPESAVQTSAVELTTTLHEISSPAELSAIPVSSTQPEIREWKVPRSKFSSQSLRAEYANPVVPTEPMPIPLSREVAKLKSDSQTTKAASEESIVPTSIGQPPSGVSAANFEPKSPIGSTFSADTKRSLTGDEIEIDTTLSKRRKRRGLVEPIRTDIDPSSIGAPSSISNISSDDELMEELQSAVLQDAKPISVAKSPISPKLPSPKKKVGGRFSRAVSSSIRRDTSVSQKLSPSEAVRSDSSRSVSASAAYLNRINSEPAKPLAKKVNLGSGISQRIKALEKLSANADGTSPSQAAPATVAAPAFFSVRKGNARAATRSPTIAERADSLARNTPSPSPSTSRESSPEQVKVRDRSGSIQNRLNAFSATSEPNQPQNSRPESISVTARIIRDPNQPFPKAELGRSPSDYAPLDLKQSPLVIDHQKAINVPQSPKEVFQERRLSTSSRTTTKSRRSSITVVKDFIHDSRSSFSEHRGSITLEPLTSPQSLKSSRSSSRPPSVLQSPVHQRPGSVSSHRSGRENALSPPPTAGSSSSTGDEKDKKSSRASRMIRRMSSSLSSSRKVLTHSTSPTLREESEPLGLDSRSLASSHPSHYSITISSNIGDVNVQFPDTLLWKRRSMLLDSQGTLILSPALSNSNNATEKTGGATRRFHLSEFRPPSVPDVETQELPNSVVLDFIEGGGLQVACEDRSGQMRVLSVLQEAHRNWATYGH